MKLIFYGLALFLLVPSLAFGQNVGATKFISVTPTITAGAYSTGQDIGGKLTFTNALRPTVGSGYIVSVCVSDKNAQAIDLDFVPFNSNPSATTITDTVALDIDDADISKVAAPVNLGSASRFAFADNSTHCVGSLAIPVQGKTSAGAPDGTIYGVLVARGAYTGASTGDITVTLGISQD